MPSLIEQLFINCVESHLHANAPMDFPFGDLVATLSSERDIYNGVTMLNLTIFNKLGKEIDVKYFPVFIRAAKLPEGNNVAGGRVDSVRAAIVDVLTFVADLRM